MKKLILILCIVLVYSACKKEDDNTGGNNNNTNNNPPQPTKKELITAKAWKYHSWTVDPALKDSMNNPITDYLAYLPACTRDNLIIFHTNANVDIDEGTTKCDPQDPQTKTASWFFMANETAVNMYNTVYTIDTLTKDTMRWKFTDLQGSTTHTHTIVFVH